MERTFIRPEPIGLTWTTIHVIILHPGERHWQIFSKLRTETPARGPLVMDAHLAALAIEHGVGLATTDKDSVRFPGLRVLNPLDN